jgi:hypothetical protein
VDLLRGLSAPLYPVIRHYCVCAWHQLLHVSSDDVIRPGKESE